MVKTLTPQEQALRAQILQRWGGSGAWDNDSVDLAGDLARRMYASGIADLDKLQFTPTKRREQVSAEYQGTDEYRPAQFADYDNAFDLTYDGKAVGSKGFIGDINRDGSLGDGNVFGSNTYNPNLLAWNSGGKGAHNYEVSFDEKGNPIVTPVFQSSSFWNSDLGDLTKFAAMSVGMYGAATGLAGTGTAAPGATTAGTTAGTSPGLSTVAVGADSLAPIAFEPITAQTLAGSGTAIQGGGTVGGSLGLGGATVGNGAWLGEGVGSGIPSWDAAAIKSAVASGELGTAASYGLQTLEGGTALETAGQLVNPTTTAANQAAQQVARQGSNNNLSGWDQLARIGGGLAASAVAGNALADPVNTSRFDALFDNILKEQQTASQRGADLWENYQSTWRPLEQKFAESALNFDTPQRREEYAQRAGLAVADNYAQQRQEAERDMMAAGLDPSTIASLGAASRAWEAKDRAGASNDARLKVEMAGLDLLSGGANFARTMSNAATDQSRVATGNTQAASGILNQQAGLQNKNTANRNALIGDLFSGMAGLYGMYTSERKAKKVSGKVDGLAALDAVMRSPSSRWSYKEGHGDGSTQPRMGPMADDLAKVAPQVSDGKKVDAISMLGLHHAAIGELARAVRMLTQGQDGVYEAMEA